MTNIKWQWPFVHFDLISDWAMFVTISLVHSIHYIQASVTLTVISSFLSHTVWFGRSGIVCLRFYRLRLRLPRFSFAPGSLRLRSRHRLFLDRFLHSASYTFSFAHASSACLHVHLLRLHTLGSLASASQVLVRIPRFRSRFVPVYGLDSSTTENFDFDLFIPSFDSW